MGGARTLALSACAGLAFACSGPLIRDIPMLRPGDRHFEIEHVSPVRSPQFRRAVGNLLGPQIEPGNRVETLVNGDQIFPSMLAAIRGARRSIDLESYIYWKGEIGEEFTRALCERARAGVAIHVVLDWFGSLEIDSEYSRRLEEAGVELNLFHQLLWYDPTRWKAVASVEERTHRKILVVDGRIGFTGGAGIADVWSGNAESPDHWRDTHFRVTGPVVAQLQSAFVDNWLETGGELLQGDDYFPPLTRAGTQRAQVFKGSPQEATENVELMIRLAIASAERSIDLSSAYFVPDPGTVAALRRAAERGVRIRILVPGEHIDVAIVEAASMALWGDLLRAGVEIYRYQPTMFHCKVLVIDGAFSSLGSTNFDNRSFRLNDEVNLNVFDRAFAAQQTRIFERDLRRSQRFRYEDWKHLSWYQKGLDWFARGFRREM